MAYKIFLFFIQLALLSSITFGDSKHVLDRPLAIGPQYPLIFMSTVFEPNTAFLLDAGEISFQASYTLLNAFVYSGNSDKAENPSGSADVFNDSDSTGYSVYLDGEMERRFFNLNYGYSDNIELQFSYRDFRLFPGSLDSTIENFHKSLGISNQGRENAGINQLGIYVHDNETNENVFVVTETMEEFKQESITLGLRFLVKKTEHEAISVSFSSNSGDYFSEREINDSTADIDQPTHRDFNDYNFALRYSSLFTDWSLHAAFSISFVGDSLLTKSPKEIYYFFLGAGMHVYQNWDLIFQLLEYTSPFPSDSRSKIGEDIFELTAGLRWTIGDSASFDIGFTENLSQGPQNIDIAFFSNLMFYL